MYDQNDFNEVLRRADETMSSVRSGFHESSYTNGKYFIITNLLYLFENPENTYFVTHILILFMVVDNNKNILIAKSFKFSF